jgi:hypothetical protein
MKNKKKERTTCIRGVFQTTTSLVVDHPKPAMLSRSCSPTVTKFHGRPVSASWLRLPDDRGSGMSDLRRLHREQEVGRRAKRMADDGSSRLIGGS